MPAPHQCEGVTNTVIMVRPDSFGFNPGTAESNAFAFDASDTSNAIAEFEGMVSLLLSKGVTVHVLPSPDTLPADVDGWSGLAPDSVFPNNW
jgi:hypothetical protein